MEIKKSIRDIKGSNPETISDMVPTKPIRTVIETHVEEEEMFIPPRDTEPKQSFFKKINKFYLMAFILILAGVLALIFVKSRATTNPVEQAKKESEMVKKELSKHVILPTEEQIDIRKITNKLEDPFFKDAQVGDYLVILYKNRIAFIYSVDKDIIVNAGVVFIDPKTATTTGAVTKPKK